MVKNNNPFLCSVNYPNKGYFPSWTALFVIDFAVPTFEMSATNLKLYSRPREDQNSTVFKWIFPMWIARLLWLSFSCTTTALSVSQVKRKCILYPHTHTPRGYWTQQSKPSPRFFMMRAKKRCMNTMRCARQFEEPNQDRRSRGVWLQMLRAFAPSQTNKNLFKEGV